MDTNNQSNGSANSSHGWKHEATPLVWLFLKQRRYTWIPVLVGLFSLLLGYCLLVTPQTFQSTVSLSMQNGQAPSAVGSLLGLGGGGGGNKSYLGVLKSRNMAKSIAKQIHLREMLSLPNEETATGTVQGSIKVDDVGIDGLMYIHISLTAPAILRAKPAKVTRLCEATARIANAYPDALRTYMQHSDTDEDLTLRRDAEAQLQKFRRDYNAVNAMLVAYIRANAGQTNQRHIQSPGTAPAPTAQESGTTGIANQLVRLYENRGQLEENKIYLDTQIAGTKQILQGGTQTLSSIPAEDDILNEARSNYNRASDTLESLRISYGDANPAVVSARERLKLAENRLNAQLVAIQNGKTSIEVRRKALDAQLDLIRHQIGEVERMLPIELEKNLAYTQLQREQELRFEALKQGLISYNTLSMQTVSAQNRLNVVDEGLVPQSAKISLNQFIALDIIGAIFGSFLYMVILYLIWERQYRQE